jgi:hypothetical protein
MHLMHFLRHINLFITPEADRQYPLIPHVWKGYLKMVLSIKYLLHKKI